MVELNADPDLIWDAATHEVIAGGDVVARNIEGAALAHVIDRTAAVRWLKLRSGRGPQPIQIFPNGKVHKKGQNIEVVIGGVEGRSLVLFNLAGDGTFQLLYPLGSDPPFMKQKEYRVTLVARDPLGSDQIIAISSTRRMNELEKALKQLDRTRSPGKVVEIVAEHAGGDAWLGSAAIFTAP